jgi:mono/diheme cytochrome c family protein
MSGKMLASLMVFGILLTRTTVEAQEGKRAPGAGEQTLIVSIRGDNLYKTYCASCHGEDAHGHGPMAVWLKVPPSDLTRIAARNGGQFPLGRVDRIISGEEALPSGHATRAMPIWGPIFSQVTRD